MSTKSPEGNFVCEPIELDPSPLDLGHAASLQAPVHNKSNKSDKPNYEQLPIENQSMQVALVPKRKSESCNAVGITTNKRQRTQNEASDKQPPSASQPLQNDNPDGVHIAEMIQALRDDIKQEALVLAKTRRELERQDRRHEIRLSQLDNLEERHPKEDGTIVASHRETTKSSITDAEEQSKRSEGLLSQQKHDEDRLHEQQQASDNIKKLKDENSRLMVEVRESSQTIRELEEAYWQCQQKLDDRDKDYQKVSDQTITDEWRDVIFAIQQTVANCLGHFPTGTLRLSATTDHFDEILRLAKRMKGSSKGFRGFQIQAYLWKRIVTDIFRSREPIWGGVPGTKAMHLCNDLQEEGFDQPENAAFFSRMKSMIAHQLDAAQGTDGKALGKYVRNLTQDLEIFTATEEGKKEVKKRLRDHLLALVHKAHNLRVILMKSKAFFMVAWPRPGLKGLKGTSIPGQSEVEAMYSVWNMKKEDREVMGVVSPRLLKRGHADGHGFEMSTHLVKPTIVVAEPETEEDVREAEFKQWLGEANADKDELDQDAAEVGDSSSECSRESHDSDWEPESE